MIAAALAAVLAAGAVTAVLLWPASSAASATPTQESVDAGFARDMGDVVVSAAADAEAGQHGVSELKAMHTCPSTTRRWSAKPSAGGQ
ncbi:hypothetical protein ACWEP4_27925 [Streptomyces sp. NPDC004227]